MTQPRSDVLQGTLDLVVLKTLDTVGSMHGYGIAQRIHQVSNDVLSLNQGTLYPALLRLEQRGWIASSWGTSEQSESEVLRAHPGRKDPARARRDRMAANRGIMGRVLGADVIS